mmetsp:Transcript_17838/g.36733  ORF Transcript_17838/g.36733 Transcript_17838/m.36733 type:complete len:220 (+) Transcript_17838:486-1145(+)
MALGYLCTNRQKLRVGLLDSSLSSHRRLANIELDTSKIHVNNFFHIECTDVKISIFVVFSEGAVQILQLLFEYIGRRKLLDGILKVLVFLLGTTAQEATNKWHHVFDKNSGGCPENSVCLVGGFGKFQNGQDSVGLEQLVDLTKGFRAVRDDVADSKGHGSSIELLRNVFCALVVLSEVTGVCGFQKNFRLELSVGNLRSAHRQHVFRGIKPQHSGGVR